MDAQRRQADDHGRHRPHQAGHDEGHEEVAVMPASHVAGNRGANSGEGPLAQADLAGPAGQDDQRHHHDAVDDDNRRQDLLLQAEEFEAPDQHGQGQHAEAETRP